jgi:hypothetical protein
MGAPDELFGNTPVGGDFVEVGHFHVSLISMNIIVHFYGSHIRRPVGPVNLR